MQDSVFTKIIKGEIPCHKLYEDDLTFAFLDIRPVRPGMTLAVSKRQVANFEDLPDEDYVALWQTVKKLAKQLRKAFPECLKIAVQVEGLDVEHVHVKLFPIQIAEDLHAKPTPGEPDHNALEEVAEKIRAVGEVV